ncbi:hypothetical protein Tco_0766939 [Tanacetum coccineum]
MHGARTLPWKDVSTDMLTWTSATSALTPVDLEKPLVKDGDVDDVDISSYSKDITKSHYAVKIILDIERQTNLSLCIPRDSPLNLVAYTNSWTMLRATLERKSTTGVVIFGKQVISWQCKKQTVVATSTTKAEYVAAFLVSVVDKYHEGSGFKTIAGIMDLLTKGFDAGRDSPFDLEAFSDSDYAGASLDKKSTTGGCQFLGRRLISWQCKKQTIVANSTTEAEYVAAANCYGQVDSYEKKLIQVIKIHTDHNVADLLIKAFDVSRYETVYKEWEDRMERAATTASSLEIEQDSGNINRTQSMATLNESFSQGTNSGSSPRCQVTILGGTEAQTRFEAASKQSNDLPLSRFNILESGENKRELVRINIDDGNAFCHEIEVNAGNSNLMLLALG